MSNNHEFQTKEEISIKYDIVFIIGDEHTPQDIERLRQAAQNSYPRPLHNKRPGFLL